MTMKDYIAIAGMFAETLETYSDDSDRAGARRALHYLARQFCTFAHRDNSRFDESRFMAACRWETT